MKNRVCSVCGKEFPLNKEYWHKSKPQDGGFRHACKSCENLRHKLYRDNNKENVKSIQRKAYLKKKFNITLENYSKMLEEQDGLCFICNREETSTRNGKVKNLAVDHCHKTGKVRSLLCQHCNTILGKVNESTEILDNMINYIHFYEELR